MTLSNHFKEEKDMNIIFIGLMIGLFLIGICAPRENESQRINSAWKAENLQSNLAKAKVSLQNIQKNDFNTKL